MYDLASPRRCLALSPLQAAAAGTHQAQPVDPAGCPHTAPQEIQTGNVNTYALIIWTKKVPICEL